MDLTARDIHEKQFHDAWRGYDQEEVDDFLDRVAETLDRVQRENATLHSRIRELDSTLSTNRNTEEMMKRTLASAQRAAEEAIAQAKAKAERLVAEAEERARRTNSAALAGAPADVRNLDATRVRLEESVDRLGRMEREIRTRLRAFFEQQLRALGSLDQRPSIAEAGPTGEAIPAPPASAREERIPAPPPAGGPEPPFSQGVPGAAEESGGHEPALASDETGDHEPATEETEPEPASDETGDHQPATEETEPEPALASEDGETGEPAVAAEEDGGGEPVLSSREPGDEESRPGERAADVAPPKPRIVKVRSSGPSTTVGGTPAKEEAPSSEPAALAADDEEEPFEDFSAESATPRDRASDKGGSPFSRRLP